MFGLEQSFKLDMFIFQGVWEVLFDLENFNELQVKDFRDSEEN